MKTLKDKVQHPCSDEYNMYWEKDLKQAIKDLKDKLFIKTKKGKIVIPACKIIPTIDEVMGRWEE